MGILKIFSKPSPAVQQLPAGTLTMDRHHRILTTTVSSNYPPELLQELGDYVLRLFRDARKAQMPLAELNLHFASLKVTARELRGGAIIFLSPNHSPRVSS